MDCRARDSRGRPDDGGRRDLGVPEALDRLGRLERGLAGTDPLGPAAGVDLVPAAGKDGGDGCAEAEVDLRLGAPVGLASEGLLRGP